MFIPVYNLAKFRNPTDLPKIAEVINNNDPKKLGRIKVKLEGLYDPEDKVGSNLPWIRKMTSGMGLSTDERNIPFIGDKVELIWPYDNKHAFYRGMPYGETSNIEELSDYDWGWVMESGTAILVDKNKGNFLIKTAECSISGDNSGNLSIKANKITLNASTIELQGNTKITGTLDTGVTTISGTPFLDHIHGKGSGSDGFPTNGVVTS